VSSRFRNPTHKGTELWPNVTRLPCAVRFTNVGSTKVADILWARLQGEITNFYHKADELAASGIATYDTHRVKTSEAEYRYINNHGQQLVYVKVNPKLIEEVEEEEPPFVPVGVLLYFPNPAPFDFSQHYPDVSEYYAEWQFLVGYSFYWKDRWRILNQPEGLSPWKYVTPLYNYGEDGTPYAYPAPNPYYDVAYLIDMPAYFRDTGQTEMYLALLCEWDEPAYGEVFSENDWYGSEFVNPSTEWEEEYFVEFVPNANYFAYLEAGLIDPIESYYVPKTYIEGPVDEVVPAQVPYSGRFISSISDIPDKYAYGLFGGVGSQFTHNYYLKDALASYPLPTYDWVVAYNDPLKDLEQVVGIYYEYTRLVYIFPPPFGSPVLVGYDIHNEHNKIEVWETEKFVSRDWFSNLWIDYSFAVETPADFTIYTLPGMSNEENSLVALVDEDQGFQSYWYKWFERFPKGEGAVEAGSGSISIPTIFEEGITQGEPQYRYASNNWDFPPLFDDVEEYALHFKGLYKTDGISIAVLKITSDGRVEVLANEPHQVAVEDWTSGRLLWDYELGPLGANWRYVDDLTTWPQSE